MLEYLKLWIVTILIAAFIVNIVDMILPDSKLKPYINLVLNFIFVFIVINPVINFFAKDTSLEDAILTSMTKYNKEYVDSINDLSGKIGNKNFNASYEDGLKEVLKLKLDEYGYDLDEVEFDGSKINRITVKEKNNSNKDEKEDIQSKESENSKQVFKNKENDNYTVDLDEEKLKEDLVKILDVSIETIQID